MSSFFVKAANSYIEFRPALPSSVCEDERINITIWGWFDLNSIWRQWCEILGAGQFYPINVTIWENDAISNDLITYKFDYAADDIRCEAAFYTIPFQNVRLSDWAGGVEGNTIEVFAKAVDLGDALLGSPAYTSSYDIDILYTCDCLSGSCCDLSSRPYKYKPSGSQPTGYTDEYTCSGENTPVGTNWVYKIDYYCDGVSSSAKSNNILVDTCGPCKYCTEGDPTCNYYDSSTICGIEECDYLDTDCRDYHDKDRYCNGAGTCLSPSCDSYTNEPKHTSCGTGRECDGSGNCITCTSNDHTECYDNDVYWYDKCDNRGGIKEDCREDSCSSSWSYYCSGNDLMRWRWCFDRGCSNNQCYTDPWRDEEFLQTCSDGCIDNGDGTANCKEICYKDSDCGSESRYNPHCGSDGNVYMTYRIPHCARPGQPDSYCYWTEEDRLVEYCQYGCEDGDCITPDCSDDCRLGDTRCNGDYLQSCGNYDSDVCLEYPSSTSGSGNDDCSDCSCSCGSYNTPEVDDKCNDGKDNDCDGLLDVNDPGCGGVQLDIQWEHIYGETNKEEQGNSISKVYGGYMAVGYVISGSSQDSYVVKSSDLGKGWYYNKEYTEASSIVEIGPHVSLIAGSTKDHYALEENPYTGGTLSLGGSNVYLAKIGYNGDQTEVGVYGAYTMANQNTDEYGYDVVTTSTYGSYIVAGMSTATGNLWKTYAYVWWISENGNKEWGKGFLIKDGENTGYSIARKDYDFFVTGYATPYQIDRKYIYILKIDYLGNKMWSKEYGTGIGYAIEVTLDNGLVIVGTRDSSSYILKTDINGNKLWDKTLDSGEANSVKVDSDGNYIVLATKNNDIQIFKVSSNGDVLWKKTFTTGNIEKGKEVIIDAQQYLVTGKRDNNLYIMKTGIPCIADCTSGKTRCNGRFQQICGNYDSDVCLEYPSSTSGSGNDDCSDCSCSCGNYSIGESKINGNCNDGKDNDCDGKMDTNDPDCCNDECLIEENRCNGDYKQTCGNYDLDNCLEWPSSTSGSGNDNCTDCSCLCGGYKTEERMANQNCDDGKDNDCDGQTDYGPLCRLYFNISLNKGWNLISFPLNLKNNSIQAIFKNINFSSIFSYDPWLYHFNTTRNNFNKIDETKGYWVNSLRNQTLKIEGLPFGSLEMPLKIGWNLIGYPSLNVSLINKTINTSKINPVLMYNNSKWYSYNPNRPSKLNNLTKFTPGYGYWVKK